jgi:hypothetical protein
MLSGVMFKITDPQLNLFGVHTSVGDSLRQRLSASWAPVFRTEVLPILMRSEEKFSILYGSTGRPNYSVGRMLGICVLQEWNNLADQEALDTLGFDLRWRHALDVSEQETYLSRRSLVEFRRRLVCKDPEIKLIHDVFIEIGGTAIEKLGISTSQQRLDSTHIESNIRYRGRLTLFQDTIHLFLKKLSDSDYQQVPQPIRQWHEAKPEGWFGLGENERKARLLELAKYTHTLIELFSENKVVKSGAHYRLIVRLFKEQCEIKTEQRLEITQSDRSQTDERIRDDTPVEPSSSNEAKQNDTEIEVKKKVEGGALQSAFDTDASYGHKGTGYSAHITETCNNVDKPEIITDYEVHGANRSDMAKAVDVLDRLEKVDLVPETLFADGGYPSVPSVPQIIQRGVELISPVNRTRLGDDIMSRERFVIDGENHVICCPEGHAVIDHRTLSNGTDDSFHAIFDGNICRQCAKLEICPVRAPNHRARGCGPRDTVGNFRLEITEALRLRDAMFEQQKTREWKDRYKIRSGIEATMSELKRLGLGKLRVRGLAKVLFVVACKVIACNIKRWWNAIMTASKGRSPQDGAARAVYSLLCALSGLMFAFLVRIRSYKDFICRIPFWQNSHICMA